jgi:hypothetical protein
MRGGEAIETLPTQVGRDGPVQRLQRARTTPASTTIDHRHPVITSNGVSGEGGGGRGDEHILERRQPTIMVATIIAPTLGLGTASRQRSRREGGGGGTQRWGGEDCGRRAWSRRRRGAGAGLSTGKKGWRGAEGRETHLTSLSTSDVLIPITPPPHHLLLTLPNHLSSKPTFVVPALFLRLVLILILYQILVLTIMSLMMFLIRAIVSVTEVPLNLQNAMVFHERVWQLLNPLHIRKLLGFSSGS